MSEVRVNNIVDYGGKGAPTFDNGAVISGVSSLGNQAKIGSNVTITSGGINVSGVTTAATLSGNLTGDVSAGFLTATSTVIGSGVTINAGGLNITGVMTATTFEGSGASMTGVAMTIAPLAYNPDPSDSKVTASTGIGITFDHRILAGSGNITLSVATNAGAAGTVVENFGVGSSVTIAGRKASIDPTSDLTVGDTYHISYPSGCFTNTGGDVSYVGTAYTFGLYDESDEMFRWGYGASGAFGNNLDPDNGRRSSPVQITGNTWRGVSGGAQYANVLSVKSDGTLWSWGSNAYGAAGQNSVANPSYHGLSSPTQIPGTNWSKASAGQGTVGYGIKTDGTLWAWGFNGQGQLGQNSKVKYSSPVQIPGTIWRSIESGLNHVVATKTDGTLWCWGSNDEGLLGQNNVTKYSSPIQVPGTTWSTHVAAQEGTFALKTDGTFWAWGKNGNGQLGQNSKAHYSSPVQIPGTWSNISGSYNANMMTYSAYQSMLAINTDGELWGMGYNEHAVLGQNNKVYYSSPIQVGSDTTWSSVSSGAYSAGAIKTDGTLWNWGTGSNGQLGVNSTVSYSSPIQVPGTDWTSLYVFDRIHWGVKKVAL